MGCWLSGPWNDQTLNGRSLTHLSQRDALQILAAAQHPITMQIKSQRRGQKADHTSSWEPLPLGLQHLNLPRSFYSQLPVPPEHCDPRFGFMSSSPRDTLELGLQDPELGRGAKEPGCLDCCAPSPPEPPRFTSQDEEDFLLDAPMGYLPLHHELDSGLGWTDGSVHQGELSGLETEEGGVDECLPRPGLTPGGCTGLGGSPSSESFISSELSDSGFYSVSTGEFRHFQRLLEKRMRLYNARLQLQNEPCERRERRDSCPKSHLLEAIPESLPVHRPSPDSLPIHRPSPDSLPIHRPSPDSLPIHRPSPDSLPIHRPSPDSLPPCPQHGLESDQDLPQRGLFRVSSVQFHKSDRPSLNRHSSSSGALFNPAHSVMSRLNAPVLSTCSTPSSHRRALLPHGPPQPPPQPLRRSRTLHYRPPQAEYRRRASHPASPSYYTLHQCPTAAAMLEQQMYIDRSNTAAHCRDANYEQYWRERSEYSRSIPDNLVMEREREREREQHLQKQKDLEREMEQKRLTQIEQEHQRLLERERERQRLNHLELEQKLEQEQRRLQQMEAEREKDKRQKELDQKEERERQLKEEREVRERREKEAAVESNRRRFRDNNSSFSQSGEANDTWPKPASRNLQHSGGSRGMYSTLDAPAGSASGSRVMYSAPDANAGSASGSRVMYSAPDANAGSASGSRVMYSAPDANAGSASGRRVMYSAPDANAGSASGSRVMYSAPDANAGSASGSRVMYSAPDANAGSASGSRVMYSAPDANAGSASGSRVMYSAPDANAGSASGSRVMYSAPDANAGSASGSRVMYSAPDANAGSASGSRVMYSAPDANAGSASGSRVMYSAPDANAGSASGSRVMYSAPDANAGSASGSRVMYSAPDANAGSASGSRVMYSAPDANAGSVSDSRGTCAALEGSPTWDMKKAQTDTIPNAKLTMRPMAATRVSRSQMLRDRASQLADERSGMSTDEETSADMLLGRYWSRTERKEHFLLAREIKQQQQARGDRSSSRERERVGNAPEQDPRANTVLELSHRKLTRLRNRKLLDDWTTMEELLTHGSRLDAHEDALTCPSSLLTVTTV